MLVYRLCRAAHRTLDGEGARLYGGRWNSVGTPVVYASSTRALAALEYLIHVEPVDVPGDLVVLTIDVPDDLPSEVVDAATLPPDWEQEIEPPGCKSLGDTWVAAGVIPVLRVPAAPIPEEQNVLINPRHADASRIHAVAERAFSFDPRLLA